MSLPILDVESLYISAEVGAAKNDIVRDVSFSVAGGECLAIAGESGSGKTMTALSIMGLLPKNCGAEGRIILSGCNLLELVSRDVALKRGSKMAFIPQSGAEYLNPMLKVKSQIYETLDKVGVKEKKAKRLTAVDFLGKVGFSDPELIMNKYPFQLSGGQAQRVVLAISMCCSPDLVIADEPTIGVDEETAGRYISDIRSFFPGSGVIIITHNISAVGVCDKLLIMLGGAVMEYGSTEKIMTSPVHPYTKSLINALPRNGFDLSEERAGFCREFSHRGCPFHSRCKKAQDICRQSLPKLIISEDTARRCHYA